MSDEQKHPGDVKEHAPHRKIHIHHRKRRRHTDDDDSGPSAIQPPPPALIDLLGPRDHVKFLLPFSDRPEGGREEDGSDEESDEEQEQGSSKDDSSSDADSQGASASSFAGVWLQRAIIQLILSPISVSQSSPPPNRLLTLISNVDNADDVELIALILLDANTWQTLAAIPIIPELLQMSSQDPTHLRVVMAKSGVGGTGDIVIEGWSRHV